MNQPGAQDQRMNMGQREAADGQNPPEALIANKKTQATGIQYNQRLIVGWDRATGTTNWRLRRALNSIQTLEGTHNKTLHFMLEMARQHFRELETIKCLECDGHGHTSKACPTRKKIVAFSTCHGYTRTFVN